MPRQKQEFLIVYDRPDGGLTFFRGVQTYPSGVGQRWDSGIERDEARLFTSRDDAATVLHQFNKHKEGWRILNSNQVGQ